METLAKTLENFNAFLEQSLWFRSFKFVLGLYMLIIVAALILILYRMITKYAYFKVLRGGQEFPVIKPGKFQSRWNEAEALVNSPKPDNWKASVLMAAEMLNEVFEIIGYKGETLGEKLNNLNKAQVPNLEQVKKANEVKNNIVKNEKFQLNQEDAKEMMRTFKKALQSFEAIN